MTATIMWKASFTAPHADAERLAEALEQAGHPEPQAISLSEKEDRPDTDWRIEAYYGEEPARGDLENLLAPLCGDITASGILTIERLPETDWVAKSLQGLPPVRAGRFFVHGAHDAGKVPANAIPLLIDAGQAFGTGHHPTTWGCLSYIDDICRRRAGIRALDLGCGTGLLAIALAKRLKRQVWASDIDPLAVRIARGNAHQNGVAAYLRPIKATGFGHPELARAAPFDLIVANILARPLAALAPAMRAHLRPGGEIVLSGILRPQEPQVRAAYAIQGLYLRGRKPLGDWVTLHLS